MLLTIAVALMALWLMAFGLAGMSGHHAVHLLLLAAAVIFGVQIVRERRIAQR